MDDGGSGVLTPEMVLAAARPPLEALGARSGRASERASGRSALIFQRLRLILPTQLGLQYFCTLIFVGLGRSGFY